MYGYVRRESPVEFFRELVDGALAHQHIEAHRAHRLLHRSTARRISGPSDRQPADDEPLALKLAQALERSGSQQRATLKQVGDLSLFLSGFFADSLQRKLVDVDYYVSIGGYAYHA